MLVKYQKLIFKLSLILILVVLMLYFLNIIQTKFRYQRKRKEVHILEEVYIEEENEENNLNNRDKFKSNRLKNNQHQLIDRYKRELDEILKKYVDKLKNVFNKYF